MAAWANWVIAIIYQMDRQKYNRNIWLILYDKHHSSWAETEILFPFLFFNATIVYSFTYQAANHCKFNNLNGNQDSISEAHANVIVEKLIAAYRNQNVYIFHFHLRQSLSEHSIYDYLFETLRQWTFSNCSPMDRMNKYIYSIFVLLTDVYRLHIYICVCKF